MRELLEPLGLDFLRVALVAGLLVGGTCAYLGTFLVLKRVVFLGAALAEVAALGLALGLLLGAALGWPEARPALVEPFSVAVSFVSTVAAIVAFWLPWNRSDVSRESVIGVAWAAAIALTTIVVALNPGGELHELDLLSGNLLFLAPRDLVAIAVAAPVVWLLHALLRKEFVLVSLDMETARTMGLPARTYDLLIHLSIGLTISVAMRLVGILFVFAALVIPPVLGLLLGRTLATASAWSVVLGALGVLLGVLASYHLDLPTGPAVVATWALLGLPVVLARRLRRS